MTDPSIFYEHIRRTGEVICQICCESKPKDQMQPVSPEQALKNWTPGLVWDICRDCAAFEIEQGAVY